jgi:hypothetical protein
MTIQLAPSPGYTLEALTDASALAPLTPHLGRPELWSCALVMGEAPDAEALLRGVHSGDFVIWRQRPTGRGEPSYAILSRYADAWDIGVFSPGGYDVHATMAGLEALTGAIFGQVPECAYIWSGLVLPTPAGAEEALVVMGWTYTPAPQDRGIKRTFELSREVFLAYQGADP